jgi:adenylate kinase
LRQKQRRIEKRGWAMRIVLLGPPGAGKGTQAKLMQEHTGAPHISSGDLLRAAIADGSDLGRAAQTYMHRGELVPDSLVIDMIDQRLRQNGADPSFMLDGFPRTVGQAQALESMLAGRRIPLDHVVSLEVPREELVRRLSGRRTCQQCGAMYHLVSDPPRSPAVCDRCGGQLFQRDDDREDTIRARLAVYDQATAPLTAFYRTRNLLREIDGTGGAPQVLARILARLNGSSPGARPASPRSQP